MKELSSIEIKKGHGLANEIRDRFNLEEVYIDCFYSLYEKHIVLKPRQFTIVKCNWMDTKTVIYIPLTYKNIPIQLTKPKLKILNE